MRNERREFRRDGLVMGVQRMPERCERVDRARLDRLDVNASVRRGLVPRPKRVSVTHVGT